MMLPTWINGELMPAEAQDLTEQISQGFTRDPSELFSDQRRELQNVLPIAVKLVEETPW